MNKLLALFNLILIKYCISIKEWWEESKVLELTNDNFNNYIKKDKYILVKFYTKWCDWCRRLSPVYEKLFEEFSTKREDVLIARLEAHINGVIASKYGIFSFPYLGLFIPGSDKIKDVFLSERELNTLIKWVDEKTPVRKKSNLQGGKSLNVEVNRNINDLNSNITQSTNQEDYFKIEINKMTTQLRIIEEEINELKTERRLTNRNHINKYNEDEKISRVIKISITPRRSLYMLIFSIIMILFYFSILKYQNKHN